jgi:hypothetical protein
MDERFETFTDNDDEWFSDIELRAMDLEKELSEWRESRTREFAGPGAGREAGGAGGRRHREFLRAASNGGHGGASGRGPAGRARPGAAAGPGWPVEEKLRGPAGDRRQVLIERGRRMARRPRARRGRKVVIGCAAGLAVLVTGAVVLFRPGPSWPASVAAVQGQITAACQNPNVASEPGQVNFACAKDTSQVLWVFSLLASGNNPGYGDGKTGRKGLEPITAAQGGQIAWSLNLHHPYDPLNPVDSLAVAARAINNIIGGATLTGAGGSPAVQPGLEGKPENCARYTGSAALITRAGFPARCASPVTSQQGRAALVADVYQQWMPGAGPVAAQDAAVLFQNAGNPGDPQVQAILKTLPDSGRH